MTTPEILNVSDSRVTVMSAVEGLPLSDTKCVTLHVAIFPTQASRTWVVLLVGAESSSQSNASKKKDQVAAMSE